MIIRLLNFLKGFVVFSVFGSFPDIFFKDCRDLGVRLFDIRVRNGRYLCCTGIADYKRLRKIRRKSKVKIHIEKKCGIRFLAFHNRNRIGIPVGIIIAMIFLGVASTKIWSIKIVGNETIEEARIFETLEKLEIEIGMKKNSIDPDVLSHALILEMPEVVWAAFNVNGSVLTVEVDERVFKPETVDNKSPCNIIADFDGIIENIEVLKGVKQVTVGSGVKKGDLLVSGVNEYSNGITAFLHSQAKIVARTTDEITLSVKKSDQKPVRTGRKKRLFALGIYNTDIPLYLKLPSFAEFEKATETKQLSAISNSLPLKVICTDFFETEQKQVNLSFEEAQKMLKEMLKIAEKEKFQNAEIIEMEESFSENDDTVTLTVRYVLKKSIGEAQEITVSP